MATEAPLFHHSQCTAAVNMSSTAGLNGFNGTGQFLVMTLVTASRTVTNAGASTVIPVGILQNDPILGFVADIGFLGVTKMINGVSGALAFGATLMTDGTGRVIVWTTAGTNYSVGYTLEAATAQNQVVTAMVMPISKSG